MKWRAIFTDSERMTGVAPECDQPDLHVMHHGEGPGSPHVYGCCPPPQIEAGSEGGARRLAAHLTELDARPCP